ncbi:CLAVATA3/ESR (CLE)-related protein TDIF [Argentina anserina]|uniref:CLAVATA3/ESR (CLE)-related protein TDIF n=1 Tax=Argentina anserina TaxID=57926 RepID=UPI0021765D17|nr:CLAVATA3/ESR (CLE)-related protein TDIF [Potentilla anserina]
MDIEPLWALGGWFIFPNCMASAPKSISESHTTSTKLHPLILSLTLVFVLLLFLATPLSNPSTMASKRLLLADTSATTTTDLQPKKTQNSHTGTSSTSTRARSEFGAEAHEVPSGPNPISN